MLPQVWHHASKFTRRKIIAGLLLVAVLCYSDIYDARSHKNRQSNMEEPLIRATAGLYLYKLRHSEEAFKIWHQASDQSALAQICLYWTGQIDQLVPREIEDYRNDPYHGLLEKKPCRSTETSSPTVKAKQYSIICWRSHTSVLG